jgi:hypothetical protein
MMRNTDEMFETRLQTQDLQEKPSKTSLAGQDLRDNPQDSILEKQVFEDKS